MSEICDQIRACVRSARARVKCKIDKINWSLKISETHASKATNDCWFVEWARARSSKLCWLINWKQTVLCNNCRIRKIAKMFTIYDWMCLNVAFFSLFSSRLKHLFFLFYADSYRRHLLHLMSLFCSAICAPVACVSSVVIILLWLFLLSYKCMRRAFFCCLLNFYVHIHWAMACININNLNFVSAHLVGISSVHIYPLYVLPSLCDIFFLFRFQDRIFLLFHFVQQ